MVGSDRPPEGGQQAAAGATRDAGAASGKDGTTFEAPGGGMIISGYAALAKSLSLAGEECELLLDVVLL
jgi:hypothetical protein